MSQPRFLADENFRNEIIEAVRRIEPSIEIATVQELALDGTPDPELLQLATDEGWLLLSHDVNTLEGEACRRVEDGRGIFGVFMVK